MDKCMNTELSAVKRPGNEVDERYLKSNVWKA